MRFVWPATRRSVALGVVTGALIVAGLAGSGGQALAATPAAQAAPLAGSASAVLTQVNAGEWTTTVYLDTAALCAGKNPAGNRFSLVTGKPSSITGAAAPAYPDGPLRPARLRRTSRRRHRVRCRARLSDKVSFQFS